MKYILLIIIILLITPYYSFSDEYITIRVCKAVAGCPVNIETGECPTCINEKRKVKRGRVRERGRTSFILSEHPMFDCKLCIGYFLKWKR